jgi:hypothetical protein
MYTIISPKFKVQSPKFSRAFTGLFDFRSGTFLFTIIKYNSGDIFSEAGFGGAVCNQLSMVLRRSIIEFLAGVDTPDGQSGAAPGGSNTGPGP